jgi:hypothetical protein
MPYEVYGFYHQVGALTRSGAPGREPAMAPLQKSRRVA